MLSICVLIWIRGTLPRLRQDQLMNFAWKFVLPMTLLNLVDVAVWRFMGEGWLRWVVCSAILAGAYVLMGRAGMRSKHFGPGVTGMRIVRNEHSDGCRAAGGAGG